MSADSGAVGRAAQKGKEAPLKKSYRWEDINSAKVVEIKDDKLVIDGKVSPKKFRVDLLISPSSVERARGAFGIPYNWLRIKYKSQEELRQKQSDIVGRASARGISFDREANAFGADYGWIVIRSRDDVKDATARLHDAAQDAGYESERQLVGLMASFVQSIPYKAQPLTRKAADGSEVLIAGIQMPLETLANGYGDCDTKCVLFGALLGNVKGTELVFLQGGGHVFVGVRATPKPRDRFVRLKNKSYVLVELTTPWILGHIPGENLRGVQAKKFKVIPLQFK